MAILNTRVTTIAKNALLPVPVGTVVFDTDLSSYQISNDGTTWVDVGGGGGGGDLLAANNLSDVASKETSLRNLGAATGDEQIFDNIDRVYTTATQPAVMQVVYDEPDHSIQLCPFNEVGSPIAGPFWGLIQNVGASSFVLNDAAGSLVSEILPGQAFLIKNDEQTLGGGIQILPYTAFVNENVTFLPEIGLSSAYESGSLGNIGLDTGRPFKVQSKGSTLDGLSVVAGGSGSKSQPGVEATVYSSTSDIRITALQVVDVWFTLPGTRTVGVYDRASQTLLGSIDIAKTDTLNGIYRQKQLTNYIDIPANTEFVVAKRYLNGEFIYGGSSAVGNTTITVVEGGESLNTPGLEFPQTFDATPGSAQAGFFTYEILSDVANFDEAIIDLDVPLIINDTTSTTSSSTGSLINAGGFGNAGDIRNDGDIWFDQTVVSQGTSKGIVGKIVCNEAIGVNLMCKASSSVAFRIEVMKTTDGDDTVIVGMSNNATGAAGQVQEVRGLVTFKVVIDSAVSLGDPLEKSALVDGQVVAAGFGNPGTFCVALESGIANDTILAAGSLGELF